MEYPIEDFDRLLSLASRRSFSDCNKDIDFLAGILLLILQELDAQESYAAEQREREDG